MLGAKALAKSREEVTMVDEVGWYLVYENLQTNGTVRRAGAAVGVPRLMEACTSFRLLFLCLCFLGCPL